MVEKAKAQRARRFPRHRLSRSSPTSVATCPGPVQSGWMEGADIERALERIHLELQVHFQYLNILFPSTLILQTSQRPLKPHTGHTQAAMTASPAVDTTGDSPTAVFRRTLHLPTLTPPLRLTLLGADPSSRDPINPSSSSSSLSSSSSSTSTSRVWSSTHPLPRHLPFLANLHLHTILALTPKHPFNEVPALEAWSAEHNVQVRHVAVAKWKDDGASSLTRSVIEEALPILLDRSSSPLLVISTAPQLLAALLGLLRLIQGYDLEKGVLPEMARALRSGLEGEAEEEDRVGCEKWVRGWVGKELLVRLQKERVNDWVWPMGTPLSLLRGAGLGRGKGHSSSLDEGERARGGVNGAPAQGQAHLHAPYRSSTVASLPTVVASGSSSPPSVVHPYLKIRFQPEQAKEDAAAKAKAAPAASEPSAEASQASHSETGASESNAATPLSEESSAAKKSAEDASGSAPSTSGSSTSGSSSSAAAVPPREAPAHVQPNLPPLYTSTASSSSAIPSGPSSAPTPTIPLPPASFSPDPTPSAPPSGPPLAAPRRTHGRKRSLTISEGRSYSKGPEAEARMGRMTDAAAAAAITCSGIDIDGGGAARRLQLGQQQEDDEQGLGRPASLPVGSTSVVGMGVAQLDGGSGGGGTGRGRGRNAGGGADRRPDLAFLDVTPPTGLNIAVHGDGEGADAEAMPRTPTQLNRSPSGSRSGSGGQWASQRRPSGDTLAVGADEQGRFSAQDMTPTASRTSMSAASASASASASAGPAPVSAAPALWRRRRRSSAATTTTAVKGNAPAALSGAEELSDGEAGDTTPKGVSSPAPTPSSSSSISSSFPTTPRPLLSRGAGHQVSNSAAGADARANEPVDGDEEEEEDEDEHHLTPKAQARSQPIFGGSNNGASISIAAGGGGGQSAAAGAMDSPAAGGAAVSTMLSGDAPPEGEPRSPSSGDVAETQGPSSSIAPTSDSAAVTIGSEADEEGDATVRQDEFLSRASGGEGGPPTSAPAGHAATPAELARPTALHAPQPGRPAMMHSQTGPPSSPVPADGDDDEEEEEEEEEDDEDEDDSSHPISAGLEALDLA